MKKSLLAIVFAAATLPLTFAQAPAPATQSKPADQKSTAAPKKTTKTKGTKTPKHGAKKSTTSATPQK